MSTYNMARGRCTNVRSKRQSNFITGASGIGFVDRNTYGFRPSRSRGLESDEILGSANLHNCVDGRPAAPALEEAGLSVTWPLDLLQIGYAFAELCGPSTTSGSGPYVHTFASGAATIPVTTFEHELSSTSRRVATGAVMNRMVLTGGPGAGYREVVADYMARSISPASSSSIASSPVTLPLGARVPRTKSALRIDGVQVGALIDWTLTLQNVLGSDRYDGDALLSDVWREGFDASLTGSVRYTGDAITLLGDIGTGVTPDPHAVVMEWPLSSSLYLSISLPAVRFEPMSVPVEGGGAMTVQVSGRAEVAPSAPLMTAALVNGTPTGYA